MPAGRFHIMKKSAVINIILAVACVMMLGVAAYFYFSGPKSAFLPTPEKADAASKSLPFPQRMAEIAHNLNWKSRSEKRKLTREILEDSFKLGAQYLVSNQKSEGNFNYQYDFILKIMDKGDNQVRQAGALWGVALIFRHAPDVEKLAALQKGLDFFFLHTKGADGGRKYIKYPGERSCSTGTVALTALAIIETLRAQNSILETGAADSSLLLTEERRRQLEEYLDAYLAFLKGQIISSGHFSRSFTFGRKLPLMSSPYFDGESLLAMCKAARYLGRTEYLPTIEKTARILAEDYTVKAWAKDKDSNNTKGFYQWGSMAFNEYSGAGWKDSKLLEDVTLTLGWWMIHTHKTLIRTRNTAYAYEGLVSAYDIARRRDDKAAMADLGYTIDRGLYKLTSWQVGGPLVKENSFLKRRPTTDKLAVGGVMNHRRQAPLRIDVTQHQMHAVILALNKVYTP